MRKNKFGIFIIVSLNTDTTKELLFQYITNIVPKANIRNKLYLKTLTPKVFF